MPRVVELLLLLRVSAIRLRLLAKKCQSLLGGHCAARHTFPWAKSEYLYVGVALLARTAVTGQNHKMRTASSPGRLARSHEDALICGGTIGYAARGYCDTHQPASDIFAGERARRWKHYRRRRATSGQQTDEW